MTNCRVEPYNYFIFSAFCVMLAVPVHHVQVSKLEQSSYLQN